eukprot:1861757-Rhodomonas_salina.1
MVLRWLVLSVGDAWYRGLGMVLRWLVLSDVVPGAAGAVPAARLLLRLVPTNPPTSTGIVLRPTRYLSIVLRPLPSVLRTPYAVPAPIRVGS